MKSFLSSKTWRISRSCLGSFHQTFGFRSGSWDLKTCSFARHHSGFQYRICQIPRFSIRGSFPIEPRAKGGQFLTKYLKTLLTLGIMTSFPMKYPMSPWDFLQAKSIDSSNAHLQHVLWTYLPTQPRSLWSFMCFSLRFWQRKILGFLECS